jgi:hypothetical protein
MLIETRNEAATVLAAVERAPRHPAWAQLTDQEKAIIELCRAHLQGVMDSGDVELIRTRCAQLDQATRRFAELMMEDAVSGAIRGKTMETAGEELKDGVTAPHAFAPAEFK